MSRPQGEIRFSSCTYFPATGPMVTAYRLDVRLGSKDYATGWTGPYNARKLDKTQYAQALRRIAKAMSA